VFVVADREKRLVLEELVAATVRVAAAEISHVVTVRLEPPDHRVFGGEQKVERRPAGTRDERTVVADLVSAAGAAEPAARAGALIKTVSAVSVVSLPAGVGSLDENVRRARVVADDEYNMARAAVVRAHE